MASRKKLAQILHNIYVELYANAEPSADFNKLLEEAEINDQGEKVVDYDAYEIDKNVMANIVEKHTEKLKKWEKNTINFHAYLGPSPRTKKED